MLARNLKYDSCPRTGETCCAWSYWEFVKGLHEGLFSNQDAWEKAEAHHVAIQKLACFHELTTQEAWHAFIAGTLPLAPPWRSRHRAWRRCHRLVDMSNGQVGAVRGVETTCWNTEVENGGGRERRLRQLRQLRARAQRQQSSRLLLAMGPRTSRPRLKTTRLRLCFSTICLLRDISAEGSSRRALVKDGVSGRTLPRTSILSQEEMGAQVLRPSTKTHQGHVDTRDREARNKHAVAEYSSPRSSSSNSAHNPVVPFPDTSTKIYSSVDANNFMSDFYNDMENVTKLKELLEITSPDEPTEMHGAVRDITRSVRASRRLRSIEGQYLTPARSLTLLGPPLPLRCHRRTTTTRTPCALTRWTTVAWCPRVPFQHFPRLVL